MRIRKIIIGLIFLVLLSSCTNSSSNINKSTAPPSNSLVPSPSPSAENQTSTEPVATDLELPKPSENIIVTIYQYEEYVKIVQKISDVLKIPDFTIKTYPIVPHLVFVDKELSLNGTNALTVDGTPNDFRPTQHLLIYENENNSVQLQIRFSYTTNQMGKALVSRQNATFYSETTDELSNKTDLATYTYNNLIITILQNAKEKADNEITKSAMRALINVLDEYEK